MVLQEQIAFLKDELVRYPNDSSLRYRLAVSLIADDRIDEAIEQYQHIIDKDCGSHILPLVHNNIANLLVRQGRLSDAIDKYFVALQSLRCSEQNMQQYNNLQFLLNYSLGNVFLLRASQYRHCLNEDLSCARECFLRAHNIIPNHPHLGYLLGMTEDSVVCPD